MTEFWFDWIANVVRLELEERLELQHKQFMMARRALLNEIQAERESRLAAQRGLVPYVASLELFDAWLKSRPKLKESLREILQQLGLWEIKMGYDPHNDVTTTIVSPQHPAWRA